MKPLGHQLVWTTAAVVLYSLPFLVAALGDGREWFHMVAGVIFGAVWLPRPHEIAARRNGRDGRSTPPTPPSAP